MADADEDAIPTSWSQAGEEDLEDEAQDFRFLAQLAPSSASSSNEQSQSTIPKRGTKDFEPNATRSQVNALDASRSAMHNALSALRVHNAKNHIVGQYLPEDEDWRWEGRNARCVVVYKFKSTHAKAVGQADFRNWVWFLPEEALFLLERGSLDVRWPDVEGQNAADDTLERQNSASVQGGEVENVKEVQSDSETSAIVQDQESEPADQSIDAENNVEADTHGKAIEKSNNASKDEPSLGALPMSLQGAYASFIGKNGLSLERYLVYTNLKRCGYIVQRASTWHDDGTEGQSNGHIDSPPAAAAASQMTLSSFPTPYQTSQSYYQPDRAVGLIYRLVSWLFTPDRTTACPPLGPLISPGLYRNYNDIFRDLALIPFHPHQPPNPIPQKPKPPFVISFDVWKPNTKYRKSAPPPPDYRVAVLDARSSTVPTLDQLGDLLDSMPSDELPGDRRLEARLKHGRRNVLVAVVDGGVISYLRFSDAEFGSARLFEERRGGVAGYKGKGKGRVKWKK